FSERRCHRRWTTTHTPRFTFPLQPCRRNIDHPRLHPPGQTAPILDRTGSLTHRSPGRSSLAQSGDLFSLKPAGRGTLTLEGPLVRVRRGKIRKIRLLVD